MAAGFLDDEIEQFYSNRKVLQQLTEETESLLTEKFSQTLSTELCQWLQQNLGMEAVRQSVARLFQGSGVAATDAAKPCILVVGQTKSGKSSFINELLGGTFVAQSESPCTARVTRLTYAESPRVRVLSRSGRQLGAAVFPERPTIDEDLLKLRDEDRDNEELTSSTVEAALPCDFLRHGVDVVDSPGLNENASLDSLTLGAVSSFLPIVIYVVDGRSGVTASVQSDLRAIGAAAPDAEIFFLVTKLEASAQAAAELGRSAEEIEQLRAERVFRKLQRLGFLPPSAASPAGCASFLCVSCREVRRHRRLVEARRRRLAKEPTLAEPPPEESRWVASFEEAKLRILDFARRQFASLALAAGGRLRSVHCRVLTMFMDKAQDIKLADRRKRRALSDIRRLEAEIHRQSARIAPRHREQLLRLAGSFLSDRGPLIREEARRMRYSESVIGDGASAKEIERRCVEEIRRLVNDRIALAFGCFLRDGPLKNCFDEFQLLKARLAEYEKDVEQTPAYQVLKKTLLDGYSLAPRSFVGGGFAAFFANFGKTLRTLVTNPSLLLSRPVQDPEWKDYQAKCYLKSIDRGKLVDCLTESINDWFSARHSEFEEAMRQSEMLIDRAHRLTNAERESIMQLSPVVARLHMNVLAVISRYELRDFRLDLGNCLGTGAQGQVFPVLGTDGSRRLAAKRLRADRAALGDIATEVYHSSVLQHPNLVRLVGVRIRQSIRQSSQWSIELYMPLMHADASSVMEQQQLPLAKRLWIGLQLANALEFLHDNDLIHRDVKLGNLLVNEDISVVKLSDFGLLKCQGFVGNSLVGTPVYLAPELIRNQQYGAAVDIFSFGVSLWYLAEGSGNRHPAYVDDLQSVEAVLDAASKGGCRPQRLDGIPDRLWHLMTACWSEEAKLRPTSSEAQRELLKILECLA